MTERKFIAYLAQKNKISYQQAQTMLDTVFNSLKQCVEKEGNVVITNLGKFYLKEKSQHAFYNSLIDTVFTNLNPGTPQQKNVKLSFQESRFLFTNKKTKRQYIMNQKKCLKTLDKYKKNMEVQSPYTAGDYTAGDSTMALVNTNLSGPSPQWEVQSQDSFTGGGKYILNSNLNPNNTYNWERYYNRKGVPAMSKQKQWTQKDISRIQSHADKNRQPIPDYVRKAQSNINKNKK